MAGTYDISRAAGLKQEQVEEVFIQVLNFVNRGERVRVNGFGTFAKGLYKGRTLTTPAVNNGEPMILPDTNVLKFKQSAQAKQRLNSRAKKAGGKKAGGVEEID